MFSVIRNGRVVLMVTGIIHLLLSCASEPRQLEKKFSQLYVGMAPEKVLEVMDRNPDEPVANSEGYIPIESESWGLMPKWMFRVKDASVVVVVYFDDARFIRNAEKSDGFVVAAGEIFGTGCRLQHNERKFGNL